MAKYRLLAQHVIAGGVREAGTEVGDGTNIPFDAEPTPHMEGLDAAGKRAVAEVHKRHFPEGGENLPGFHKMAASELEEEERKVPRKVKDDD